MSLTALLRDLSSPYHPSGKTLAVILAAGHGKRIKSEKSKMLHEIWGVPTVERVHRAMVKGLPRCISSVVVGVKAADVAGAIGRSKNTRYVWQKRQNGTGHAVQVALQGKIPNTVRHCYVLPGDMGLLNAAEVRSFHKAFLRSGCDMMVLTGIYEGDPSENYYGRIIRAKPVTRDGKRSRYAGAVIEIKEHRDIQALKKDYTVSYRDEAFTFSPDELLAIPEFNSGVYGFKMKPLLTHINRIDSDNTQGEIYLTDLIAMFNQDNLKVGARSASDATVILGFNNKSVLKEMDNIARQRTYELLKDVITFHDPDHFFLADQVVDQIVRLDKKGQPLDIVIGEGVHVGPKVKIGTGLKLGRNATVEGTVKFGRNVSVGEGSVLNTYPGQEIVLGDNVEIMVGDQLNGNITIAPNTRIEGGVRITGSDDHPVHIGSHVRIKGSTYLYGCIIEEGVHMEHCFIKQKRIRAVRCEDGSIQPVRFYRPMPEGMDSVVEMGGPIKGQ
ncbi:MAG: NTP transferase domain-containing protein [Sedimentisphaerales bacterium]|nr:NTP transferase domain-containing protein [Sedimentisphaerales bacterium]